MIPEAMGVARRLLQLRHGLTKAVHKIAYGNLAYDAKLKAHRGKGNLILDREDQRQSPAYWGLRQPTAEDTENNPIGSKDRTLPPGGGPADGSGAVGEKFTAPSLGSRAHRLRAQLDLLRQPGVPPQNQAAGYEVTANRHKKVTKKKSWDDERSEHAAQAHRPRQHSLSRAERKRNKKGFYDSGGKPERET